MAAEDGNAKACARRIILLSGLLLGGGYSTFPNFNPCLNGMPHCGAPLLGEQRRHIREKRAESFRHGRMRENGIAQSRDMAGPPA